MIARRAWLALGAAVLAMLACGVSAQGMTPDQREAVGAAERWLERLDTERYADAWTMASEPFRTTIDRQQWRDGIRKIRKDYGRMVQRKPEKAAYIGERPGPDHATTGPKPGMQISLLFDTKFVRGKQATEEVTMVLEKDGVWRTAGYYIR